MIGFLSSQITGGVVVERVSCCDGQAPENPQSKSLHLWQVNGDRVHMYFYQIFSRSELALAMEREENLFLGEC